MKQWNSAHGYLYCEDAGTTIGGDHLNRYWPYQDTVARSHASLLQNAVDAVTTGDAVSTCGLTCRCTITIWQFLL